MSETVAFKNYINSEVVDQLAKLCHKEWSKFPKAKFKKIITPTLETLEFSGRTQLIAKALRETLPEEIPEALEILNAILPEELIGSVGVLSENYWLWPLGDFIRDFGSDHPKESLEACYQLTQRFSAEFAIRPLLEKHGGYCFPKLKQWTQHSSEHIRRLVSEGTRPRLPWATRLDLDREKVLPLLEALKNDKSKYVQKSVANHLNDLGKEDPDWLVKYLKKWNSKPSQESRWIIKHALRNHIKNGHPKALELLGYGKAKLQNIKFEITPHTLMIGDHLQIEFQATNGSKKEVPVIIDFAIHYQKASGSLNRKVFKWKQCDISAGETIKLKKKIQFVERSTRKLHLGEHKADVQINGEILAEEEFDLLAKR